MNMASNVIEEETDNDMDWNVVSHKKKSKKFFGHSEDTRLDTHRQKRKRRSTGGASNSSPKSDDINKPKISNETFKNYSTDEKLDCIFSMLQNMTLTNVHVQKLESAMPEVKSDTAKVKSRVDVLAYKSIDSEARQRQNNLIFYGIEEGSNENCSDVLSTFLGDKLSLDREAMCIQRVHRLGRRKRRGQAFRNRPIIAVFRDTQDVELILSNAKRLKGTPYGINRDYPKEIADARRDLYKELKQIKHDDKEADVSLQYLAKLVVDGSVRTDRFPKWRAVMKKSGLDSGGRKGQRNGIRRNTEHLPDSHHSDESARDTARDSSSSDSENEQRVGSTRLSAAKPMLHVFTSSASLVVNSPPGDTSSFGMAGANASSPVTMNGTIHSNSTDGNDVNRPV